MIAAKRACTGCGRYSSTVVAGRCRSCPIEGGTVECDTCGERHPATYHHDGQFGEGPVYEVTCTRDGLADYYLTERVSVAR